jgi:probable phosphoglycerate mutase
MRLILVRHGHPNYKDDCLTALGHKQAAACAERLREEPISAVYTSTCGRAVETGQHISNVFGLETQPLEFMREIRWGSSDGTVLYQRGSPWLEVYRLEAEGAPLSSYTWEKEEPFCHNKVVSYVHSVWERADIWLKFLG